MFKKVITQGNFMLTKSASQDTVLQKWQDKMDVYYNESQRFYHNYYHIEML